MGWRLPPGRSPGWRPRGPGTDQGRGVLLRFVAADFVGPGADDLREFLPLALVADAGRPIEVLDEVGVRELLRARVLGAVVIELVPLLARLPDAFDAERLAVELRILEGDGDGDALAVGGRGKALDRVHARAGRQAESIELELSVVADGVDHQRVALPVADRVAEVARLEIRRVLGVQPDSPVHARLFV